MINKMMTKINQEIDIAVKGFNVTGENDWRTLSRINGMIAMLEIATGKSYGWSRKGIFEKK